MSNANPDCNRNAHTESYGDRLTNGHCYCYADDYTYSNGDGNRDAAHPYTYCRSYRQAGRNPPTTSHACTPAYPALGKKYYETEIKS